MMGQEIYIVTYWTNNSTEEPIVTAFDNQENAEKCHDHFSKKYNCCIDKVKIYSTFSEE